MVLWVVIDQQPMKCGCDYKRVTARLELRRHHRLWHSATLHRQYTSQLSTWLHVTTECYAVSRLSLSLSSFSICVLNTPPPLLSGIGRQFSTVFQSTNPFFSNTLRLAMLWVNTLTLMMFAPILGMTHCSIRVLIANDMIPLPWCEGAR